MDEIRATCNKKVHIFYCDHCGKKIGVEEEYSEGCHFVPGWFNPTIEICTYINEYKVDEGEDADLLDQSGIYEIDLNLCDDCKKKYVDKFVKALLELGFERTGDV